MHRAFRLITTTSCVLALAGLAACGSVPLNSPYPTQTSYPGQYPAQYPNQYPSQYPAQGQYPAQNPQGNYVEYGRVTNMEVLQTQQQAQGSGLGAIIGGVAGAVVGHQIGRGTGRDVATVVGAVGDAAAMRQVYAKLAHDKNQRINTPCPWLPGIYINTAHGSRGLATAPLCGEAVAAAILGLPSPLSPRLQQALHPNRLVIRSLTHHQPWLPEI